MILCLKDLVFKTLYFGIEGTFVGQLLMWLILWIVYILIVHNLLWMLFGIHAFFSL